MAASTAEAEYISAAQAVKQALWLRVFLADLGIVLNTCQIGADKQQLQCALIVSSDLQCVDGNAQISQQYAQPPGLLNSLCSADVLRVCRGSCQVWLAIAHPSHGSSMQDEDEVSSHRPPCVQITSIVCITVSDDCVGAPPIYSAMLSSRCHVAQQSCASFPVNDCRSRPVLGLSSHGLCDVWSGTYPTRRY